MNEEMLAVLKVLAEFGKDQIDPKRGHYQFTSTELRSFTSIPEERLNDVVKLLRNAGLVTTEGKNTSPFTFRTVILTSEGRFEFERIRNAINVQKTCRTIGFTS